VGFKVDLDSAGLTLSASQDTLTYLTPLPVTFTVKYLGEPLPAGTEVTLRFDPSELSGLAETVTLGDDGTFIAPALTALIQSGQINISASAMGLNSNEVGFKVDLDSAGLTLSASQDTLTYLNPTFVTFTVRYLGQPLPAGNEIILSFDPSKLSGLTETVTLGAGGTCLGVH
jgi:hypothetical protein